MTEFSFLGELGLPQKRESHMDMKQYEWVNDNIMTESSFLRAIPLMLGSVSTVGCIAASEEAPVEFPLSVWGWQSSCRRRSMCWLCCKHLFSSVSFSWARIWVCSLSSFISACCTSSVLRNTSLASAQHSTQGNTRHNHTQNKNHSTKKQIHYTRKWKQNI